MRGEAVAARCGVLHTPLRAFFTCLGRIFWLVILVLRKVSLAEHRPYGGSSTSGGIGGTPYPWGRLLFKGQEQALSLLNFLMILVPTYSLL